MMKKRLLCGLLAVILLLSLLPASALAADLEDSGLAETGWTVTAFDALDAATAAQTIPQLTQGGAAQSPTLPGTLTATVEGAEQPATIENVEWSAEPGYDQTVPGVYVFSAALPEGYTPAAGVSLPTITVTVEATAAEPSPAGAAGNVVTGFESLDAATAAQTIPPLTQGGAAQSPTLPGTLTATVEGAEQPVTIENVEWSAEPAYDQTVPGDYIYTAALPEGYTLAAGVSLPTITVTVEAAAAAPAAQTVSAWEWDDPDELVTEGVLAVPGVSEAHPALFEDITAALPGAVLATVEGEAERLTLAVRWFCPEYPAEGAYEGEYTFTAALPADYALGASAPALSVTVQLGGAETQAEEQFTLTPGGTYWFDLSAQSIPGAVNTGTVGTGDAYLNITSVPDDTLTWVPFTYAGTVNAYVLNSDSSGVVDSSAQAAAATEPDTYGYRYDHSLFIADYAVVVYTDWMALKDAGFIFGKAYSSGGVSYTLRAPSMGSNDELPITPAANEWDAIRSKSVEIKNYNNMNTLGQDTMASREDCRVVSGPFSPSDRSYRTLDVTRARFTGYRPVLELPASLVGSSLNVVTLNLGGGHLTTCNKYEGAAVTQMNIVYAGASFAAPTGNALTAPEGSTGEYFYWKDSVGHRFAPGDAVPAGVSTLTAVWEKQRLDTSWFDENAASYTITTAAQLAGLAKLCQEDMYGAMFGGKTVLLGANIDLTGYDWQPIPWGYGTFDGQGHAITNMNVTQGVMSDLVSYPGKDLFSGLFAYARGGTKLCGFTVSGSVVVDRAAVTGFTGYLYAGGVVGYNQGATIINVGSSVDVTAGGDHCYAGGIAGCTYRIGAVSCILNSYANGAISANGSNCYAGGIAGTSLGDPIINCYYGGSSVTGSLRATGITYISGNSGTASYCYSNFSGTDNSGDFHGEPFADGASLLAKLNDPTVREQILVDHKVKPTAWVMGAGGLPVLSTSTRVPVTEQLALTPGGTYWFDLSTLGIPGDTNPSLPDGTKHYVPFTYAGTVNAYVLTEASNGVGDSSARAAESTDPDAAYGHRYDHSLFIAERSVTQYSSWTDLNDADLIFGKAYLSNGVDYTLRAPSVGTSEDTTAPVPSPVPGQAPPALDPSTYYVRPTTNEWDSIKAKGVDFSPHYDSWGQDSVSADHRAYRSSGLYTRFGNDSKLMPYGYLPVLEVSSALSGDDLRVVTLNLGGAGVGGATSVGIIVKTGAGFTAPGVEGLTAPTDTHFTSWTDSDGNTYAPGDPVPAEIAGLTAAWAAGTIVGDFVVTGGAVGTDYEYNRLVAQGCLRILSEKPLTISMKPGVERTQNSISAGNNVCADITLAGVNISTNYEYTPLDFSTAGESTLTLAEDTQNRLAASGEAAGIHIGTAKLTIDGDGSLEVHGGDRWPGIGGTGGTTLVIDGGDIIAEGGPGAAGIGGGVEKGGGSITINDGMIRAFGGFYTDAYSGGAGIGSGYKGIPDDDIITINGGTIFAQAGASNPTANHGGNAGIGGGDGGDRRADTGCTVIINGGTITAEGSSGNWGAGAGIGACGESGTANIITITGGVITATAGANGAAGIGGGGGNGFIRSLTITGGFIVATGTHFLDGSGRANAIGGAANESPSDLSGVTGAVIIDGAAQTGKVYGDATLAASATVSTGVTLTIPADASLTVTTGGILTNRGLTKVDGALTESGGSIGGDGEIQYAVAWSLTGISHDKGALVTYASNRSGYSATLSALRGFDLPELVTVKIGGVPPMYGYAFNKDTGALRIYAASVNDTVEITAGATLNQYSVSYAANQHGTITGSGSADYLSAYNDTLVPDTGYELPAAITMTMGGADFADFTYNASTGAIDIEASKIFGDVEISGACTPIICRLSYTGMTGATHGAKHPATHTYDTATEVSDPAKTGYAFAGWKVNGGAATKSLTLTADGYTADITLEATWTANTYTVRYNGNGSTGGATADSTHTYDAAKALTGSGFERKYTVSYNHNYSGSVGSSDTAAYTFDGWNVNRLGTGASYADRQSVTNLAESGTYELYAKWTPAGVTLPTPTRTGYTFGGWYGEEDCTSLVGAGGADYTPTAAVTLYARWTIKTYAVTLPTTQTGYTLATKSGSVSPVEHGGDYTFTFVLDEDYSASTPTIKVNDTRVTLTGSEYTIGNITAAQTVTVEGMERNSFAVTQAQLGGAAVVEIDGVKHGFTNGVLPLPDGTARVATVITEANAGDADPHKIYPNSMKVYLLTYDRTTGAYTAALVEALDDLLPYVGCSIRLTGQHGIRMITGMDEAKRAALISGAGGWTLLETGTVVAWANTNDEPVIGGSGCASNHAYKRGEADPIFKRGGGQIQFTNVLVNDFTRGQCVNDFAMRPYAKLQNASGEVITVYGGVVQRSIWYVAKQNEGLYSGAAGEFIDRIIAMQ